MAIKLVFVARLRDALGVSTEALELPEGVRDVGSLRERLRGRPGLWSTELGPGRAIRVAVNQVVADPGTPVRDGDEVAFFPPVTGG